MAPRGPPRLPTGPQERPKSPRGPQDTTKRAPEASKIAREGPAMAPRGLQTALRAKDLQRLWWLTHVVVVVAAAAAAAVVVVVVFVVPVVMLFPHPYSSYSCYSSSSPFSPTLPPTAPPIRPPPPPHSLLLLAIRFPIRPHPFLQVTGAPSLSRCMLLRFHDQCNLPDHRLCNCNAASAQHKGTPKMAP